MAAEKGNAEMTRILLQRGLSPNDREGEDLPPLMLAVGGRPTWLQRGLFMDRIWPEDHDRAERTEVLRVLLAAGADPNVKEHFGDTALLFAVKLNMSHVQIRRTIEHRLRGLIDQKQNGRDERRERGKDFTGRLNRYIPRRPRMKHDADRIRAVFRGRDRIVWPSDPADFDARARHS